MKEIGGYFELECGNNAQYHNKAIALNSGRNALRYVIRAYDINEMYVPYYTCPVVWDVIDSEKCKIIPYDLNDKLLPDLNFPENAFILYNNYFGISGKNINYMAKKYINLITDNAQAFYQPHCGIASFYSPRKFFGVPDGGLLICNKHLNEKLDVSTSYDKCSHLLKRIDLGATAGYTNFQENEKSLIGLPIQKMSKLTIALMGNINFNTIRKIRLNNFMFLHQALKDINEIKIDLLDTDVPMVYPFKTTDKNLRSKLIQNQIFVATYWPAEENGCMKSHIAQKFANTIVPLPIDQRYDQKDMEFIIKNIRSIL